MKVTVRSARKDRDGRHNDRNFDVSSSGHINSELMNLNRYYTYNGNTTQTFLELEQEYYEKHFAEHVEEQNKKNTAAGHKKRNMTLEQYFYNQRTRPEDVLLQIGDVNEHATGDELWSCAMEYINRFNDMFGDHCEILDMALHMDEATPHIHIRRVWKAEDALGNEMVSQTKALKEMDIMMPDGSRQEDRFNNQKIAFSKIEREMFTQICEEEGFIIERTPSLRKNHLSMEEYKRSSEAKQDLKEHKDDINALLNRVLNDQELARIYSLSKREIDRKNLLQKAEIAAEIAKDLDSELYQILAKDLSNINVSLYAEQEQKEIKNKLSKAEEFLSSMGLTNEFEKYLEGEEIASKKDSKNEDDRSKQAVSFF
ncbi:MAG: plasmid recombination protein [Butyrivibrio sp.]|nr:plasmid recombination protein [Butyrivibrio sp.]